MSIEKDYDIYIAVCDICGDDIGPFEDFYDAVDAALEGKVNFLIKVLKFIIAESGFELLARIELKDKKTGRCFR